MNLYEWHDDLSGNCYLRAGVCRLTREAVQEQWDVYFGTQK